MPSEKWRARRSRRVHYYMKHVSFVAIEPADGSDEIEDPDGVPFELDVSLHEREAAERILNRLEVMWDPHPSEGADDIQDAELRFISCADPYFHGKTVFEQGEAVHCNGLRNVDVIVDVTLSDRVHDEHEALNELFYSIVLRYEDSEGNVASTTCWDSNGHSVVNDDDGAFRDWREVR